MLQTVVLFFFFNYHHFLNCFHHLSVSNCFLFLGRLVFVRNYCTLQLLSLFSQRRHFRHMAICSHYPHWPNHSVVYFTHRSSDFCLKGTLLSSTEIKVAMNYSHLFHEFCCIDAVDFNIESVSKHYFCVCVCESFKVAVIVAKLSTLDNVDFV